MAGRNRRLLRNPIDTLAEQAELAEASAEATRTTLEVLARTQRSLIPDGPDRNAELAARNLYNTISASRASREALLRAHNTWHSTRRTMRALQEHGADPAGSPAGLSALDAARYEEHRHREMRHATHTRNRAIREVQLITSALSDSTMTGRKVAGRTAQAIFATIAMRVQGDVPVALYRLMLQFTDDSREKEIIYDFMVTLADLPEQDRRRFALGGLHEVPRARLASVLRKLVGKTYHSEDMYDLLAEDD